MSPRDTRRLSRELRLTRREPPDPDVPFPWKQLLVESLLVALIFTIEAIDWRSYAERDRPPDD